MFEVSNDLSWQIRKKRAFRLLSISDAAREIGISRQTLRKIESGKLKKTTKTVFVKLTDWLVKETTK
ncbi:helix-turn-helix domain-containing protein [Enterococcus sp. HY326]|uniref:helix-turn-helix domain-containing protein n=1 Tax=Enterococcus sp. HY326 TaxID=2971265 RepID=UPI00223FA0D2|nr:helix-turn-helix transcriptional regulator [Enterococcus sp. HY326]